MFMTKRIKNMREYRKPLLNIKSESLMSNYQKEKKIKNRGDKI